MNEKHKRRGAYSGKYGMLQINMLILAVVLFFKPRFFCKILNLKIGKLLNESRCDFIIP